MIYDNLTAFVVLIIFGLIVMTVLMGMALGVIKKQSLQIRQCEQMCESFAHKLGRHEKKFDLIADELNIQRKNSGLTVSVIQSNFDRLNGAITELTKAVTNSAASGTEKAESEAVLVKAINRLVEVVDNLCDRESEEWIKCADLGLSEPNTGIQEDGLDNVREGVFGTGDFDGDSIDILNDQEAKKIILESFANSDAKQDAAEEPLNDVTYRWIFPDKEPDEIPKCGKTYIVIGEMRGFQDSDEKSKICADVAWWDGYRFIKEGDATLWFRQVYAYIQQPLSADVMKQVVSLALEKR